MKKSTLETEQKIRLLDSEHSREESMVEWWFVHGYYENLSIGQRHFMVTIFRVTLEGKNGEKRNGFQLLLASLDAKGKRQAAHTWIDRASVEKVVEHLRSSEPHVDSTVTNVFIEELEQHGPPFPLRLQESPVLFDADPISVEWDDFSLTQGDEEMRLTFRDPGTGNLVSMVLITECRRMDVVCDNKFLGEGMAYHTYPRLTVTGRLDTGEDITGQAWMDHQWGDIDWFRDHQGGLVLGWDWFGINLNDGSDWIIMLHRNAKNNEPVAKHATTRNLINGLQSTQEFILTPLRYWDSPSTHIRYPIAWELSIPDLDAYFTFEPLVDEQEIATFGTMRSVWEGAGVVKGTVCGKSVTGRGRGEFYGYGYIFDFEDYLKTFGARVDRRIEEFLPRKFDEAHVEKFVGAAHWKHEPEAYTEMISVPVWDMIERSGKRWRPIFGILILEALGVISRPYEKLICTMTELIHTGALIVDDIEDDSKLRRGGKCLHLQYGVDVALNAANALYFLPAVELMNHPALSLQKRIRLHEIKERVCIDAHCGQATDIYWSRTLTSARLDQWLEEDIESKILQMYAFKTAAGAKGLADFAAVIAEADQKLSKVCSDFAQAFAVSFQIVDDIHNFSSSSRWTKVCGEDIFNGKLTFVIIAALRRLGKTERLRLQQILCSPDLRKNQVTLLEGIELVRASGSLEACRESAGKMMEEAWNLFTGCVIPSDAKMMLHVMCLKMIDLAYDT